MLNPLPGYRDGKREADIFDTQAKRWQWLAEMPRETFEKVAAQVGRLPELRVADLGQREPDLAAWLFRLLLLWHVSGRSVAATSLQPRFGATHHRPLVPGSGVRGYGVK